MRPTCILRLARGDVLIEGPVLAVVRRFLVASPERIVFDPFTDALPEPSDPDTNPKAHRHP
jgi:hypothetical protein